MRSALGATSFDIVLMVQKHTARWAFTGISLGVIASLALAHFVRGLLFEVTPDDPFAVVGAAVAFLGVDMIAAWGPSSRAVRIYPATTLRSE